MVLVSWQVSSWSCRYAMLSHKRLQSRWVTVTVTPLYAPALANMDSFRTINPLLCEGRGCHYYDATTSHRLDRVLKAVPGRRNVERHQRLVKHADL